MNFGIYTAKDHGRVRRTFFMIVPDDVLLTFNLYTLLTAAKASSNSTAVVGQHNQFFALSELSVFRHVAVLMRLRECILVAEVFHVDCQEARTRFFFLYVAGTCWL